MSGLKFNTTDSDISAETGSVTVDGAAIGASGLANEIQKSDGSGGFSSEADVTLNAGLIALGASAATHLTLSGAANPAIIGAPNGDIFMVGGGSAVQTQRAHVRLRNSSTAEMKATDQLSDTANPGSNVIISGGDAFLNSTNSSDGGNVLLQGGTPNGGDGTDGVVNVANGDFQIAGTTVITAALVLDNVTLGATLGATVQTQDDDLDDIAALAPSDGEYITRVGGAWVASGASKIATFAVSTTDATVTEIAAIGVPEDVVVTATIRGHGYEVATGDTRSEVIHATVKNAGGTSALVGTPTVGHSGVDVGASSWAFTVAADDTADALTVDVTGEAAHSIDWTITIEWTEG